jgi:hypothetical protein
VLPVYPALLASSGAIANNPKLMPANVSYPHRISAVLGGGNQRGAEMTPKEAVKALNSLAIDHEVEDRMRADQILKGLDVLSKP